MVIYTEKIPERRRMKLVVVTASSSITVVWENLELCKQTNKQKLTKISKTKKLRKLI